jgi:hypothetical protein
VVSFSGLPAGGIFATNQVSLGGGFSDGVSGIDPSGLKLYIDGVEKTDVTYASWHWVGSLLDGIHVVTVMIKDFAGNYGSKSEVVKVDTLPPEVSISSPAAGETVVTNRAIIVGKFSDAVSGLQSVTATLNGSPIGTVDLNSGVISIITGNLAAGTYQVEVNAVDKAGHPFSCPLSFTVSPFSGSTYKLKTWEGKGFGHEPAEGYFDRSEYAACYEQPAIFRRKDANANWNDSYSWSEKYTYNGSEVYEWSEEGSEQVNYTYFEEFNGANYTAGGGGTIHTTNSYNGGNTHSYTIQSELDANGQWWEIYEDGRRYKSYHGAPMPWRLKE